MISDDDIATITDCAKREDRKGLVDWVRSKRDAVWILDTNKEVTLSRFTDVNSGARSSEWLDFDQPYTIEAFREWLFGMLQEGRASEFSPFLQSKAAELLVGNLDIPTKQGRHQVVSTTNNIVLALACVDALIKAGVPKKRYKDKDHEDNFTADNIVAKGMGVSPSSVRQWFSARNKFKKTCLKNSAI
jgi:hypothetical protein